MRKANTAGIVALLFVCLLLSGCGSTGSSGTSPTQTTQNSDLSWTGSSNQTIVLDANGVPYYFRASTGCMLGKNNNLGPANFCLTPSSSQASGYAPYGATGCPSGDSACTTSTFNVVLTNNPAGTGCIAVLGNGSSNPNVVAGAITVTDTNGSFTIGGGPSATAYKTYWDGAIPICGGSSVYAGTYTSSDYSATGWTTANGSCVTPYPPPTARSGSATLIIDSGGIVDSEASKLIGIIGTPVSASTIVSTAVAVGANCTPTITNISMAQNASGKWLLSGTEVFAGVSTPFSAAEN